MPNNTEIVPKHSSVYFIRPFGPEVLFLQIFFLKYGLTVLFTIITKLKKKDHSTNTSVRNILLYSKHTA